MSNTDTYGEGGSTTHRQNDWLTIGEAATVAGYSIETLRRWDKPGGPLRAHRTPTGHRRYRRADVLAASQPIAPTEEGAA